MHCDLGDLRLHYACVGEGRPIVFLHGWTMDRRDEMLDFEPIFRQRGGWQRLYLDLPGMGETPGRAWIDTLDRFLELVLGVVDTVLEARNFLLVGGSAGGYLARGVVQRRASRIDGLLLRAPMIVADRARRTVPPFHRLIEDAAIASGLDAAEAADVLVQRQAYVEAYRRKQHASVQPAQRCADNGFLDPIRQDPARYRFSFDVDALDAPFPRPTLIVTGRQDAAVGYRDAWAILDNYPRASFAVLDRADHGLPIDQDRLFGALVNDWLDRVEESDDAG